MKKVIIFLLILLAVNIYGQKVRIINNEATQFQLREKNDTINFIVVDTVLKKKKPIFLFCQGSEPKPLFFRINNRLIMFGGGISNFDVPEITKYYHLVVISMPKTPLIVPSSHLNKQYCYVTDTSKQYSFLKAYIKSDYLQNYIYRANKVLDFLKKQPWVDTNKTVIAGHSQGSHIAPEIALSRNDITCIGLFAANPFGRIDQMIRQARLNAQLGRISWTKADSNMNHWYNFSKKVNNPDSVSKYPALLNWQTFSKPLIGDWLKLNIPIYVTYGTADITSALDDIVPLYFIREHKTNLTLKRYLGLNHNFYEIDKFGRPIIAKAHWKDVMNAFVKWSLKY